MPKLNQGGAIQFLVLLILLAGIAAGVYLVGQQGLFTLTPKAGPGVSVLFVDSNGNQIQATSSATVNVKLFDPTVYPGQEKQKPLASTNLQLKPPAGSVTPKAEGVTNVDVLNVFQTASGIVAMVEFNGRLSGLLSDRPYQVLICSKDLKSCSTDPEPITVDGRGDAKFRGKRASASGPSYPEFKVIVRDFVKVGQPLPTPNCYTSTPCLSADYKVPSGIPAVSQPLNPSPSPSPLGVSAVVLSEDPGQKVNQKKVNFTSSPLTTTYTFSSSTPGKKTLYAQFIMSDGRRVNGTPYPATIELVSAVPSPSSSPSPTPQPTQISASKRVFVTSTTYDGNLGGLSGADAKCQAKADVAKLGGNWKAWLSDNNTSAGSRLAPYKGPYALLTKTVIANDWNDLTDGSLQNPINITENGDKLTSPAYMVWTHTQSTGGIDPNRKNPFNDCNEWTNSGSNYSGDTGSYSFNDSKWTAIGGAGCNTQSRLYCFEQ